jgi:hypothetical protein
VFQVGSVIGGSFTKALLDPQILKLWRVAH